MTAYVLYGDRRSGSAAVEMALAEAGAPVTLHTVSLQDSAQIDPAFLRINPLGRIPVLVLPDGMVLTESFAILLALADLHPYAGLLPAAGSPARMEALRWMAMAAGEAYPAVSRDDYPHRYTADPAGASGVRDSARAFLRTFWRLVESKAGLDPFLLGERFSAADLYLAVLSRWAVPKPWFGESCPRVDGLVAAVAGRPACSSVWRRHFG